MIKMIEEEKCCGSCRFYFPLGRQCRRYPPTVWGDGQSETTSSYCCSFPQVREEEWCGEFKSIEKWVIPEGFELFDPTSLKDNLNGKNDCNM